MLFVVYFSALSTFVAQAAATFDKQRHTRLARQIATIKSTAQDESIVPDTYIVQFETASDKLTSRDLDKRQQHNRFYSSLQGQDVHYSVKNEFTAAPEIFNGATVVLDGSGIDSLSSIETVKNVWPVHNYQIPLNTQNMHKRQAFWKRKDVYPAHKQIGADRLHQMGITGKGQVVAVIDGGIDYKHPLLGGCFGPRCKVQKGHDFVTGNSDPYAICAGGIHGTHVAGLVASLPSNTGFSGVAPDANLYVYRAFDCNGLTSSDLTIAAFLRAYADGARIINYSGSAGGGWPEDLYSTVVDELASRDALVVSSVGDYGGQGAFYVPQPATARKVLSVGAVEPDQWTQFAVRTTDRSSREIRYYGSHPFSYDDKQKFEIYVTSNDSSVTADACTGLPSSTPDLTGRVALIKRGGCYLDEKYLAAKAFNATGVLIYNGPSDSPVLYDDGIYYGYSSGNAGTITAADGLFLLNRWLNGTTTSVTFQTNLVATPNNQSSGLSSYSQYGPTPRLTPVPKVVAPGTNILSLAPVSLGSYTVLSGTSFSAPLVAGSVALFAAKRCVSGSSGFVDKALAAFTTTATPLRTTSGIQSLVQQGAGVVNAYQAVLGQSYLSTDFLLLNDTKYLQRDQSFTIQNNAPHPIVYTLSHTPALTLNSFNKDSIYPPQQPASVSNSAAVLFGSRRTMTVSLRRGQRAVIRMRFTPPRGLTASAFPLYTGFIDIRTSNREQYRMPYLGLAAAIYDMPVLDTGAQVAGALVPTVIDRTGAIQNGPRTYTFTSGDVPRLVFRFVGGSPTVLLEVLQSTTSYVPSIPSVIRGSQDPSDGLLGIWLQSIWESRNPVGAGNAGDQQTFFSQWSGTLANGTVVPNGSYKLRIRALKVTGNADVDADYESWLSPIITVARNT